MSFEPVKLEQGKYDYRALEHALDRVKSRVFIGKQSAFYAPLMGSLRFYWSEEVDTAATDGIRMWWNPKFFLDGPQEFQSKHFNSFVLNHELRHVAGLHMLRQGSRMGRPWNWACDIRINNDLRLVGEDWGTWPAWCSPKFSATYNKPLPDFDQIAGGRMSEEDIYTNLMSGQFELGDGGWGNGDTEELSEQDKQKVINNVVRSVTNAKMEGKAGDVPGETETMLNHFLAPMIPWEVELMKWMTDLQNFDYSWARPNRRHSEIYLPSMYEDEGRLAHLVYFQDVSGSISNQEILRFNSELKYVWDEIRPKKMTVVQFDIRITHVQEFNEGDEFHEIKIIGRGGTCLQCVREFIIEKKPTAAIIFSDMQVAPMEPLPFEIPLLWVSTSSVTPEVPSGKIIHIKVHHEW